MAAEPTSKGELDELRAMVAVNLKDSRVREISAQGRYEFAYNAALLMATTVIRARGYRVVSKVGHHYFTFQALQASDAAFATIGVYFDQARDRRNDFSYDSPAEISDTDAEDLIDAATRFIADAEKWISSNFPALCK